MKTTISRFKAPALLGFMTVLLVTNFSYFQSTLKTLQAYWRHSGDILQQKWNNFVDTFGEEQEPYWVYGTSLVVFVVFWTVGGVYTIMDITGKPAFLKRDVPTEPAITAARVLKVVKQDLINQFLVDIPVRFIAVPILMMRGVQPLRELPSVPVIIAQCMFMFVCYDFSIYYAHRWLHHPSLYKYYHKVHHEWTSPIGITAFYCHPVEHLVSNTGPPVLGVLILGPHVITTWIWASYVILLGVSAHSGFRLFSFPDPEFHDFHHQQFNTNYGVLGLIDWLHGTDKAYRKRRRAATPK